MFDGLRDKLCDPICSTTHVFVTYYVLTKRRTKSGIQMVCTLRDASEIVENSCCVLLCIEHSCSLYDIADVVL